MPRKDSSQIIALWHAMSPCSGNLTGLGTCIRNIRRHCFAAHIAGQGGVADKARLAGGVAYLPSWIAPGLSSCPAASAAKAARPPRAAAGAGTLGRGAAAAGQTLARSADKDGMLLTVGNHMRLFWTSIMLSP
jgi:hypothetical protein